MPAMPGPRHSLGIDLGTSSLKVVLLREGGSPVAAATRSYPIQVPQPGWAEQSPDAWWEAACQAIRAVLAEGGAAPETVAAVCVGGQMHGTVLLDSRHTLLRSAIIWPDQRAGAEAAKAEALLEAAALLPRLGGGVAAGFMLASLLWVRAHEPDLWGHAAVALLPKDYLRFRLTGVLASEPSDGTGVPAIDLSAPVPIWCAAALAALTLPPHIFPHLQRSIDPAGAISAEAARETGLHPGTPVLCGGSDQAMAAIGAGILAPGTALISISTGGQIVTPLTTPLLHPRHGLRTLCHAVPGTYLALTATLGAGLSIRWLREGVLDLRGPDADAELAALAAEAPPGAGGLLFLPYLAGERAPLLDPATSGAFVGLRLDHGRPHLARSVLEGVAMSLRHAQEPLLAANIAIDRIILAGGAARMPLLRQIMADVLGQTVTPLETAEQSALGAALLAATHAGFFPDLEAACRSVVHYGPPVLPDPDRQARYQALYAQYQALYPALRETTHALRQLAEE